MNSTLGPPPHPAGVRPRRPVAGVREVEPLQDLHRPPSGLGPGQVIQPADHLEVLEAGEVLVHGRELARQPDHRSQLQRVADDVEAGDPGRAGVRLDQGREDADGRRLAGAVGPEEPEDGSGLDREVDPLQRLDLPERLLEAVGTDDHVVGHGGRE
jgi:hypothetical protein